MFVKILIMTSYGSFLFKTSASMTLNSYYIKPLSSKMMPCPNEHWLCLTFKECTGEPDEYFVNNTIFYYLPGTHTLGGRLRLKNIHNFTFQGLPMQ